MIYEAEAGQTINSTAVEAVKHGCESFLFNGAIYKVKIDWKKIMEVDRLEEQ